MKPIPLIVTLKLDAASHSHFTSLRNLYFPAYCNYLEAHLTLFHHLPSNESLVDEVLKQTAAQQTCLNLQDAAIKNIGNGNAFVIECNELQGLHKQLQHSFDQWLIAKDRKKLWPHITVQNKVTAFKAKQTTALLLNDFKPSSIKGIGFETWHYLNGPWQKANEYLFV